MTGLPEAMPQRMVGPALAVRMLVDWGGWVAVLVTFAALIRGRRGLARRAAIVAVAPGLVELGRTLARDTAWVDRALMLAGVTPLLLCMVCLWAGFHGHAGMPVERP